MRISGADHRREIVSGTEGVYQRVVAALRDTRAVVVVKAPPGSGKTHLLCRIVQTLAKKKGRVAVAAQTNAQADDICRRLAEAPWNVQCFRFVRAGGGMDDQPQRVTVESDFAALPTGSCVVVATTAKWGFIEIKAPFDVLLVDEAWQMQWSQFLPLGRVTSRFVLIGDPGQIPPVVAVDASRWETAQTPPHLPAPEIVCADGRTPSDARPVQLQLPASRRLPADAVSILQSFYDFTFGSWASPTDRAVLATGRTKEPIDRAIDLLSTASVVAVTNPTIDDLPPADMDGDVADLAVHLAARLLERKATVRLLDMSDGQPVRPLTGADIGIAATHRVMNELISQRVRGDRKLQQIRVDTPERWQGLQRLVMIAVHPLSGVLRPSAFDLETGRLCVMASRHQGGFIIVSRDHVGDTLDGLIVSADQPIGRPDVAGRGHTQHIAFWGALDGLKRIVRV
jgi:hypothetical protein